MARHNSPYGSQLAGRAPGRPWQPYAYYGFTLSGGGGTFHLYCPECQGEEMEVVEEHQDPLYDGDYKYIGDLMRCWVCKHEFRVTENCWKRVVW